MKTIFQLTTTPPTAPLLRSELALNVVSSMFPRSAMQPCTSGMAMCSFQYARSISISSAPLSSFFKAFLFVVLVPLAVLGAHVVSIVDVILSARLFPLFFMSIPIPFASLGIIFFIRMILLAALLKDSFSVLFIPNAVRFFAALSILSLPSAALFKYLLFVILIMLVTPSSATRATLCSKFFRICSQREVFGCSRVFSAAFRAALQGNVTHDILTHARLTYRGQSGGVSAAFPVAIGRLPVSLHYTA